MAASPRNRAFHYALLASLALHAALLVGLPELRPAMTQAVESVPLIARLLDLQPAPLPEPPKREAPPVRAKPATPQPQPVPLAAPAPVASAPVPVREPVVPQPVAAPPPPTAAVQSSLPAAPPPSPDAVDARSRDRYRIELIEMARRIKGDLRYPQLARENNWEGGVRVAIAVNAGGRASVEVRESSGYEVLDRQALEIFRRAAREVPVPVALRGKEFALEVQTVFRFEN